MGPGPSRSALLVIDIEIGFVHPEGGHWIRFAQSMVPNCVRAVELARANSRRGLLICGGEAIALEAADLLAEK